VIYIIESGEYSDYQLHAVLQGMDGLELSAGEIAAIATDAQECERAKYRERAKKPRGEWAQRRLDEERIYVSEVDCVPGFIKAFEAKGCVELQATAVHVGGILVTHERLQKGIVI
jgi:hypothetical protein